MDNQEFPRSLKNIDKKYYGHAEKRKDKLIRTMIFTPRDVITAFSPNHKQMNGLLKAASRYCENFKKSVSIDTGNYWFKMTHKSESFYLPFLCFQSFEIFIPSSQGVERFVFFEICFSGGILSVLMRKSRFSKGNEDFPAFDMGRWEWAKAKEQLAFWQGFVYPKTETAMGTNLPQQILLDYFSHCPTAKLSDFIKKATDTQVQIERVESKIRYEPLKQKSEKKQKNKLKKLKAKRRRIIHEHYSIMLNKIQKLSAFTQLSAIWPIIAYITMVCAAPLLDKSYSPQFLLNLCLDQYTDGIEHSLQDLLSGFVLSRDNTPAESISISRVGRIERSRERNHLPQILHYDKPGQLADSIRELENRLELLRAGYFDTLFAEQMPVLLGTAWTVDSRITNLQLSTRELLAATQGEDNRNALRELIDSNLYCKVSVRWEKGIPTPLRDENDDSELWDEYRKNLNRAMRASRNAWDTWWSSQRITLLSPQYINLAAWFNVLISDDLNPDAAEDGGPISLVKASLLKMEEELVGKLDVLQKLLEVISDSLSAWSQEKKPDSEATAKHLKQPFTMSMKGKGSAQIECIVFTKKLFASFVEKNIPGADPEELIDLAYRKNLLCTNSTDGDRTKTVKMGKREDDPQRDYSERCYAFQIGEIKNLTNSKVT